MWDWLDSLSFDGVGDMPGYGYDLGMPGLEAQAAAEIANGGPFMGLGGDISLGGVGGSGLSAAEMAALEAQAAGDIATGGILGSGGGGSASWLNHLQSLGNGGSSFGSALKGITGISGLSRFLPGGNASGGGTAGGNILNTFMGNPMQAAFNSTPFLLALAEANSQGKDIDNVLNKINGEAYTRSVLNPYDMDTGIGRNNMLQDQGLRGVRGSSFGDQSLNSYDYMRSLGRGDLASRAQIASAGLEGNLINQRNTNRNLLLGAGLNASGRLFEPQRDPFDLSKLLGIR